MKLRLRCTRSLWDAGLKPSTYMVATDRAAPSLQESLATLRKMLEDGENGGAAFMRLTMSELAVVTAKKKSSHSWPGQHSGSCWRRFARLAILFIFVASMLPSTVRAQVPVYEVTPGESSIKFDVESSVPIKGTFSQWEANMTFNLLTSGPVFWTLRFRQTVWIPEAG